MRAVVLEQYGGPEVLTLRELPDPVPGPEEVLVDIVGSALNRADLMQREGHYPSPPTPGLGPDAPEVPGLEFAGRVAAVGQRVRAWKPGDEVMAVTGVAGFAERTVAHERMLMPVPSTVPVADAAAIPEVWITAWDALFVRGGLRAGGVALVHAGGSGVGTAAIQLCRAVGAAAIVTCSASKVARCEALGALAAVDYRRADFVAATKDLTGGRGADVVLDVVGGDYVERNLDALALRGTIVQVGLMAGGRTTVDLGALLPKRGTIVGTVLRSRPLEDKIAAARGFASEVLPLFESGACRPVVDRRYPLEEVGAAQAYLAANESFGKVLIDIAS
ncbi:MAG: zinc-binding dehydrogenase [Acidimicrobiia bacterium]|nr:zinc-binding dehydrogenase [Acidimicrobiia bacterium]